MKSCVEKEVLFDFYHNSLGKDQMQVIKKHIEGCKDCRNLLDLLSKDISLVKDSLKLINTDAIGIPEFKILSNNIKEKNKINYSKILSWAASICLLISISTLSIIKFTRNQKPVNDYELLVYIPDMNDAWKEQSITVTHYSEDGTPIDHQIIRN
ncbi:MAG: hypothetical protein KOO66_07140 [Bacteroidales bacterium]|nr:hypothetical protein [Bacteroidales bacterium]